MGNSAPFLFTLHGFHYQINATLNYVTAQVVYIFKLTKLAYNKINLNSDEATVNGLYIAANENANHKCGTGLV